MHHDNLQKILEANRRHYAHLHRAHTPDPPEQKTVLARLYHEVQQAESRLQAIEATLGYKYDPDQPRVPAGGHGGGQWTSGGGNASGTGVLHADDSGTELGDAGDDPGMIMDDTGDIHPANSDLPKPDGIPDHWMTNPAKNDKGTRYTDAYNKHNEVRTMEGNPDSEYPISQGPYVRWKKNGQWLDKAGKMGKGPEETHIPIDDFEFIPEIFEP